MKRLAAICALFLVGFLPTLAAAQVNFNSVSPNSVIGRLGIPSQGGPAQAIPFAALVQALQVAQTPCAANTIMAGPTSGSALAPACRALVVADIPAASLFTQRTITAAGSVTVTATEDHLFFNKTTPAATIVSLPAASTRAGRPLTVKDLAGNSSLYAITITPNGGETIDGQSTLVISINKRSYTLIPISGVGWAII